MDKRVLAAVVALGVGFAAPSMAGERTGNGGFTPVQNILAPITVVVRNALCAFSGLEDNDGGTVTPGVTQTPATAADPPGSARFCSFANYGKQK